MRTYKLLVVRKSVVIVLSENTYSVADHLWCQSTMSDWLITVVCIFCAV